MCWIFWRRNSIPLLRWRGDYPEVDKVEIGLLADLAIENGKYRIKKIYTGESWNSDLSSPLSGPGINIKTGDYLLAVKVPLNTEKNLYSYFAKTAGRQIALSVNNTLF
jgi:tricorn protease